MKVDAFDTQAQALPTLDIPLLTVRSADGGAHAPEASYLRQPCAQYGENALRQNAFRSYWLHHRTMSPIAWAQRCEPDGTEAFLM